MQAMGKIEFYEIVNAWKMFSAWFQGFADEIFEKLRMIDRLSMIRVKHSFYWLGLSTRFLD